VPISPIPMVIVRGLLGRKRAAPARLAAVGGSCRNDQAGPGSPPGSTEKKKSGGGTRSPFPPATLLLRAPPPIPAQADARPAAPFPSLRGQHRTSSVVEMRFPAPPADQANRCGTPGSRRLGLPASIFDQLGARAPRAFVRRHQQQAEKRPGLGSVDHASTTSPARCPTMEHCSVVPPQRTPEMLGLVR